MSYIGWGVLAVLFLIAIVIIASFLTKKKKIIGGGPSPTDYLTKEPQIRTEGGAEANGYVVLTRNAEYHIPIEELWAATEDTEPFDLPLDEMAPNEDLFFSGLLEKGVSVADVLKNPKKFPGHTKRIKKAERELGKYPILVSTRENPETGERFHILLDGCHRLVAARKRGLKTSPAKHINIGWAARHLTEHVKVLI